MSYYSTNPHFNTSDIDIDQLDAEEAADRHDAFLRKLVDDEYWVKIRGAKAIHDLVCGVAADRYGHGSPEHCSAIDSARATFDTVIREAQAAKPVRLAQFRANDEAEAEREKPRIYAEAGS